MEAGLKAAAEPIASELVRGPVEDAALAAAATKPSGRVTTEMDGMLDGRAGERAVPVEPEAPYDPVNARRFALLVAAKI